MLLLLLLSLLLLLLLDAVSSDVDAPRYRRGSRRLGRRQREIIGGGRRVTDSDPLQTIEIHIQIICDSRRRRCDGCDFGRDNPPPLAFLAALLHFVRLCSERCRCRCRRC